VKPRDDLLVVSRASRWLGRAFLVFLFAAHAAGLVHWLHRNTLPNGYQNEIYHLDNALELWVAWQERAWVLLHHLLFEQYWPPLHYVVAFPFLAVDLSRDSFVYANLVFLALLFFSVYRLGTLLHGRTTGLIAATLVGFFPSIFGNLRHFEPNVPLTAMVAFSILVLMDTQRFARTRQSILFGLCAGLTMLVDRLSGIFFLAMPALHMMLSGLAQRSGARSARRRTVWTNVGLAVVAGLVVCGYYYVNFFQYHRQEVLSQVAAGEILDTGERSEIRDPFAPTSLLFYPLTLLDGQAGFALGLLTAMGLILVLLRGERRQYLFWTWMLAPLIVFTFIQKKQIYYTIPLLPAFAILGAAGWMSLRSRLLRTVVVVLALVLGVAQYDVLSFGSGLVPERLVVGRGVSPRVVDLSLLVGRSPIPPEWVSPRYIQSQPPIDEDFKVPRIVDAVREARGSLPRFRIGTFSEDSLFFEGYLTFFLRCAFPHAIVNGLIQNPEGFYENLRLMDVFVYVTPSRRQFPTPESVRDVMAERHALEDLEALPILSVLEAQAHKWELRTSLVLSTGVRVFVHGLRPWQEPSGGEKR